MTIFNEDESTMYDPRDVGAPITVTYKADLATTDGPGSTSQLAVDARSIVSADVIYREPPDSEDSEADWRSYKVDSYEEGGWENGEVKHDYERTWRQQVAIIIPDANKYDFELDIKVSMPPADLSATILALLDEFLLERDNEETRSKLRSLCTRATEIVLPSDAQNSPTPQRNVDETWFESMPYDEDDDEDEVGEHVDEDFENDGYQAMEALSPILLRGTIALNDSEMFAKIATQVRERIEDSTSVLINAFEQFSDALLSRDDMQRWLNAAWPAGTTGDTLLSIYNAMRNATGSLIERTQSWFDDVLDSMLSSGKIADFPKVAIVVNRSKLVHLHVTESMLAGGFNDFADEGVLGFISAVWEAYRRKQISKETKHLFKGTFQTLAPPDAAGCVLRDHPQGWPISGRPRVVAPSSEFARLTDRLCHLKLHDILETLMTSMLALYRDCEHDVKFRSMMPLLSTFSKSYANQKIDARLCKFLSSLVELCRDQYVGAPPALGSDLWMRAVHCPLFDCADCPVLNQFLGRLDQREFCILLRKERHRRSKHLDVQVCQHGTSSRATGLQSSKESRDKEIMYTITKIDAERERLYDDWEARREAFIKGMLKLNSVFLRGALGDDLYEKCIDPASFPKVVIEQVKDASRAPDSASTASKRVASSDLVSEPKRKALDRLVTGHNAESGSARTPKMRRAAKAINYLEMIGQG